MEYEIKSQHPQSLYHYIGDNSSWISKLWEKLDEVRQKKATTGSMVFCFMLCSMSCNYIEKYL